MKALLLRDPGHFLAFGFGSGLLRYAPGTFGTLAAIPLYLAMKHLPLAVYLCVTAALFAIGIWVCGRTARTMGVHDASEIVWDEVVGFLLVMAAAPDATWAVVFGFVLFRVFDIAKPWPIGWVDRRVTGGFGIMLDDALAAVPAWFLLQFTARFFA